MSVDLITSPPRTSGTSGNSGARVNAGGVGDRAGKQRSSVSQGSRSEGSLSPQPPTSKSKSNSDLGATVAWSTQLLQNIGYGAVIGAALVFAVVPGVISGGFRSLGRLIHGILERLGLPKTDSHVVGDVLLAITLPIWLPFGLVATIVFGVCGGAFGGLVGPVLVPFLKDSSQPSRLHQ